MLLAGHCNRDTSTMSSRLCMILLLSLLTSACASRSTYEHSQLWRSQQCRSIVDEAQRNDCLRQAGISYEDYRDDADR